MDFIKVLDFGLVKHGRVPQEGADKLTAGELDGGAGGTPAFMSPEQALGGERLHLSHPTTAEPLHQTVAAQLAGFADRGPEAVDHSRADVRQDEDDEVGKDEGEEERDGLSGTLDSRATPT